MMKRIIFSTLLYMIMSSVLYSNMLPIKFTPNKYIYAYASSTSKEVIDSFNYIHNTGWIEMCYNNRVFCGMSLYGENYYWIDINDVYLFLDKDMLVHINNAPLCCFCDVNCFNKLDTLTLNKETPYKIKEIDGDWLHLYDIPTESFNIKNDTVFLEWWVYHPDINIFEGPTYPTPKSTRPPTFLEKIEGR